MSAHRQKVEAAFARLRPFQFQCDDEQLADDLNVVLDELIRHRVALGQIVNTATDLPHARRLDRDEMRRIASEALA